MEEFMKIMGLIYFLNEWKYYFIPQTYFVILCDFLTFFF